jgi:hypothetical protein
MAGTWSCGSTGAYVSIGGFESTKVKRSTPVPSGIVNQTSDRFESDLAMFIQPRTDGAEYGLVNCVDDFQGSLRLSCTLSPIGPSPPAI